MYVRIIILFLVLAVPSLIYNSYAQIVNVPTIRIEICGDLVDNDNDGQIDEAGCTPNNNNIPLPVLEICGDLVDNNNNGQIDEAGCQVINEQASVGSTDSSIFKTPTAESVQDLNPPFTQCFSSVKEGANTVDTGFIGAEYIITGDAKIGKVIDGNRALEIKVISDFMSATLRAELDGDENDIDFRLDKIKTQCLYGSSSNFKKVTNLSPQGPNSNDVMFQMNPPFRQCDNTKYSGAEYIVEGKVQGNIPSSNARKDIEIRLETDFRDIEAKVKGKIEIDGKNLHLNLDINPNQGETNKRIPFLTKCIDLDTTF